MKKRYWFLLVCLGLCIFIYFKLFYTKMNTSAVPNTADMVLSIDVKKITRTIIWHYITNPSKWKISSSTDTSDRVSIQDMVEIPDYILPFHIKNERANAWYCLLQIKDSAVFEKGVRQFGFDKINIDEYTNPMMNVGFVRKGNEVLISSYASDSSNNLKNVAEKFFGKQNFIDPKKLALLEAAKSHASLFIAANYFLQEDAIVKANISNEEVKIDGSFIPKKDYTFNETTYSLSSNALLSLCFTQPTENILNLWKANDKANVSTFIGVNVDTLLSPYNKFYQLDFANIKPRIDSAITYTYDDDFNKVEKVVVNKVEEPSFSFKITGDSVQHIFDSWVVSNTISVSDTGAFFRPMPFVKSYCSLPSTNELIIASKNYVTEKSDANINAILYMQLLFTKIPDAYLKYLPFTVSNVIQKVEKARVTVTKNNNELQLAATFDKRSSIKSFLDF
jgi:hypothetical protein